MRALKALMCAAVVMAAATPALAVEKPVPGKQVRFVDGAWSAVPQVYNGQVVQCVLAAYRKRADGAQIQFSMVIGRGAGFSFGVGDESLSKEEVLDDRAEVIVDNKNFPAVGFNITPVNFAMHPGDAAGVLSALAGATRITLRSTGAGYDTGAIELVLPGDALAWLKDCGKLFNIAIDRPSDPNAPALPDPRPPSPEIGPTQWTAVGPPGMDDKQKIETWDASELRDNNGRAIVCMIRRHYYAGSGKDALHTASFFSVSRAKGFSAMLTNSQLKLTSGQPIEATIEIAKKPFTGFTVAAISETEMGIYPKDPVAFAAALDHGVFLNFKSKVTGMELPVQASVIPWLRACARRHAIPFAPKPQ